IRAINKKGVSPVVATVLLITMSVIVIAIIFIWARSVIEPSVTKFENPIDTVCENVNLRVSVAGSLVSIVNNGNQATIEGVKVRVDTGEIVGCDLGSPIPPAGAGSCTIDGEGTPEALIPILKDDNGQPYNCDKNEKSITS
ncbi:hypothetical protein IH879_22345, partial [candidate division KSB1 bacterium]|nr:hypothetical protein [candidate division KSB1 bacterium]